ncbi:MAG: CehA/McbA family metallohydrolase [Deltaproteobacteria bacterium]|nr:CehA/McbA family metallohydrolase [Deltaproteobacteria bacterium]
MTTRLRSTLSTTRRITLLLTLLVLPTTAAPRANATDEAPGALAAGRISFESFEARQVGGPDADAGLGDWFLGNGTICAAISDPAHESPLSPRGGVLIDLGHCGRADDQWAVFQPLLNLAQSEIVPIESILSGQDDQSAWVQTRALYRGVEILTTYRVDRALPTALAVSFRARRLAEGDRLFGLGAITLHASGQLAAFSLSRRDLASSRGFVHPPNDRSSNRKLLASLVDADVTILVGGEAGPPISYGVERAGATLSEAGTTSPLSSFTITGGHYTLQNALANPPWLGAASGRPGLAQLAQLPFMDLEDGAELAVDYRIWVGERADVASVTDRLFASETRAAGRVDDPSARVHVTLASGAPISEVAPDPSGAYALRLPPGRYVARARAAAGREAQVEFEVPAVSETGAPGPETTAAPSAASGPPAAVAIPPLALGTPGEIALPEGFTGRLVLLNEDGSGPVRFHESLLGFAVGEESIPSGVEADFLNVAPRAGASAQVPPTPTTTAGPVRVAVPAGRYRVLAVRGPEYASAETKLEIRAGAVSPLELAPLTRVAPTPGWIAADLHVHTGQSFDSSLPESRQIEAFAASGAEVLVSTEHDRIFDPRPAIAARGLERELVGVTGSEMTSAYEGGDSPFTSGHLNAFPLEAEPDAFRRGAIRLEGRRLRDALAELRARPAPPFVQINHPRPSPAYAAEDTFFASLGVAGEPYDPTRSFSEWPNSVLVEKSPRHGGRDLDVEAVELLNGESLERYRVIRADWLSFLLQGERLVATANSDSHRLGHVVGLPRTYVRMENDRVEAFDEAAFMRALRAGRAYGSTGPLIDLRLGEAEIGELHAGSKGVLELRVHGAEWVPIAEWRAYVDGALVHRAPIARGESASLPLVFAKDAFVTVEVEGPAEGLYRDVLPGFVPFAFSNPIFVDVDGNGRWDAPGLPERSALPLTITRPGEPD